MTVLVTGSAGFIGFHICNRLIRDNKRVIGFDNLNNYYDPQLKESRIEALNKELKSNTNQFSFFKGDLEDIKRLKEIFNQFKPEIVINLAAQAGVRYSLENPQAYISSNIVGFVNILECCRQYDVKHLIYASSSSVYGGNTVMPFSEKHSVDHPVSIYAATKKSNELMAHTYSHLYGLPTTGLRFFTVYGPWGRPDMALFLFTKAILNNEPINIFNNGKMIRDFTYIDDVIESLSRLIDKIPSKNNNFDKKSMSPSESWAPFKVFNIGNSTPTELMDYISEIEKNLGIKAIKNFLEMQPGDVQATSSDTSSLEKWIRFKPNTTIEEGVKSFISWYKKYYNI
tara:strand:- start:6224 stop:7246 length:1023 start_codon:yes stop_codon:yes gene_type:complete